VCSSYVFASSDGTAWLTTCLPCSYRHHSKPLDKPVSASLDENEVPHITIIRPVKGLEPQLYNCLASTFQIAYPKSKLTIYLCVSSAQDPSYDLLRQLVAKFPTFDAHVLVEEDDPLLHGDSGYIDNLGPNPKIRNISRAYREAKGDIVWIVDCNVWVGPQSAGHMVDKLCGFLPGGRRATPYKFVHQLPLVVDLGPNASDEYAPLLPSGATIGAPLSDGAPVSNSVFKHGGRLEEMFMSTSHAKFYSAINTVGIAPCIVGKSNMFRKSHLDILTDPALNPSLPAPSSSPATTSHPRRGLDFFSSYICEDHLIGDLLWRAPSRLLPNGPFRNHGLVWGELAIQPVAGMTVKSYFARRSRWLRVRKWTVLAATLVEPGVEPFLCSLHFGFALTTLPFFRNVVGIPPTWSAMAAVWLGTVMIWMTVDRLVSGKLHRLECVEVDENTPAFARGLAGRRYRRSFGEWLAAWLGRETLALPIWTWAVLLGATVNWRGQHFKVKMDMSVVELDEDRKWSNGGSSKAKRSSTELSRASSRSKDRID
jgi:ceramide glucosyltransferase